MWQHPSHFSQIILQKKLHISQKRLHGIQVRVFFVKLISQIAEEIMLQFLTIAI